MPQYYCYHTDTKFIFFQKSDIENFNKVDNNVIMIKKKMMDNNELFRAVVSSQSSMKAELLIKIDKLEKNLTNQVEEHRKETKVGFKDTNHRIDMLGKQLNNLDEDAPTSQDFGNLVERVTKLENQYFTTA